MTPLCLMILAQGIVAMMFIILGAIVHPEWSLFVGIMSLAAGLLFLRAVT